MKKNILISFSGGRTSAFMCKFILESAVYQNYDKLFVFANTGKEREETLFFADRCDKEFNLDLVWVEANVNERKGFGTTYKEVDFITASRKGEPFKDVIKKYGLPSKYYRHCTRELKEQPIHKFAKDYFNGQQYLTAIGIRYDEANRIPQDPGLKVYPLYNHRIDEKIIRDFWDRQKFDLNLKDYQGNCDLCFLKSKRKRMTILNENPGISEWWVQMEIQYGNESQSKFDAHRNMTTIDLVEESKRPFRKAIDKHELRKMNNAFDFDMDVEYDCFCKSNS